jgi:hypothetical protein
MKERVVRVEIKREERDEMKMEEREEIKREEREERKREEMVEMKERVDSSKRGRNVKVELKRNRRKGVVDERRGKGRI